MLKKKALALLLAAATALTVFPPPVLADETTAQSETPSVLIYSEDFESGTVKFYDSNNFGLTTEAASTTYSNATDTDNNKYGTFNPTATAIGYGRTAAAFNSDGITAGKLRVEFRFRMNQGTANQYGSFFIGNCDQVGGRTATTNASGNWLTLVDVTKDGKLTTLNVNGGGTQLKDSSGAAATVTQGKWYSCSAVLDLDNRGIDIKVTEDGDASKAFTASATGLAIRTGEWGNWPAIARIAPAKFKHIAVMHALDIDDIKIYCDPIEATGFKLVQNDDGYKGQLTFNHDAATVDEGAVKIEEETVSGTLSSDGGTYTVNIPDTVEAGKEYTVTVDQSKIHTKAFNGTGAGEKTFTFTKKKEILLYSENFEGASPEIYVFTDMTGGYEKDKTPLTTQFSVAKDTKNTQNATNYGTFFTQTGKNDFKRVGYQFYDDGIKTGKVRVKFKFRSNAGNTSYGIFLLGNNTSRWNWLACVGFNKNSVLKILDNDTVGKTRLLPNYVHTTWYSYEATIDLDKESIDASLYYLNGKLVKNLKWSANGQLRPINNTNAPFQLWPNNWLTGEDGRPFSIKSFAAYTNLDLDDIEVYCDPIEVADFKLVRNDDKEYSGEPSFLTARSGQLTFNYTAADVLEGAVKIGDTPLSGTLSSDGKTYMFDIPIDFVAGEEYKVTVDQSKIKMLAVQTARDDGDNLFGEGTKEFTFTPGGAISFSGDFDKTTLDFKAKANDGTASALKKTQFEIMDDNGNKYGRSFYILENDTTDGTAKYYTTDWSRPSIDFDENGVTDGKLKVHFRFRPTAETLESKTGVYTTADKSKTGNITSFGSVLIGNSDQKGINGAGERIGEMKDKDGNYLNDARGNWLSVIDVNYDGKLGTLGVGGGGVTLTDSKGVDAVVQKDTWYTCDAVIDLDNQGIDIRVVEDGTNKVFKVSKTGLARRVNRSEWNDWPTALQPCFKSFGLLAAIDIDDIQIQTDYSPSLTADADKLTVKITTERESSYMLIVQYDDYDRVVAVKETTFAREGTASVYSEDINWESGATRAKAFIWDNLNDANPLEKFAEISNP